MIEIAILLCIVIAVQLAVMLHALRDTKRQLVEVMALLQQVIRGYDDV